MRVVDTVVAPADRRAWADTARHVAFVVLLVCTTAWFWAALATAMNLSLQYDENYSHIVAIPFISLFLLYLDRATIFAKVKTAPRLGGALLAAGVATSWLPRILKLDPATSLSLGVLGAIVACVGVFVLCYGMPAFRKASFPLLFLFLMVPLPPAMLGALVRFLLHWSAEATAAIFDLIGVAFYREGYVFALAGLTIEIAEECSGIRSSLALFIVSLLAGQLFLLTAWSRSALTALVIPLAIVKNGVRIVVLTMLAIHVDPSFIGGSVTHRYSGIPLFAVTFAILGGIVWILRRSEARLGERAIRVAGQQ